MWYNTTYIRIMDPLSYDAHEEFIDSLLKDPAMNISSLSKIDKRLEELQKKQNDEQTLSDRLEKEIIHLEYTIDELYAQIRDLPRISLIVVLLVGIILHETIIFVLRM
jgi:peptidoglycan hydrolase CwlO-like protein